MQNEWMLDIQNNLGGKKTVKMAEKLFILCI